MKLDELIKNLIKTEKSGIANFEVKNVFIARGCDLNIEDNKGNCFYFTKENLKGMAD